MTDAPRGLVMIRFGTNTPFYMLSMSYGPFFEPDLKMWFISLDHWIGWNMLVRDEHRRDILNCPNGWVAYQALQRILQNEHAAVAEGWIERRDAIMARGVMLKVTQHLAIRDMLLKTRERPIEDHSRAEDLHWCHARGAGDDAHARMLMDLRARLRTGQPSEYTSQSA